MIRSARAALSIALLAAFLGVVATPFASAQSGGQLTFYYIRTPDGEPLEPGVGRTREPDGVIASQLGGDLNGVANKVTLNVTDEIGSGAHFLDSVWYAMLPYAVESNHVLNPVTGTSPFMFGEGQFVAWYGWWKDFDNDSRINDFHDDGRCPLTFSCAGYDEFEWRGVGNGEAGIEMILYVVPTSVYPDGFYNNAMGAQRFLNTNTNAPFGRQFGAWANESSAAPDAIYRDRTGYTETQQLWVSQEGVSYLWTDESLLLSTQAITIANARKVSTDVGRDFADPDALIDVDRYESANGDLETMWTATIRPVPQMYSDARRVPQQIGPMINNYLAQIPTLISTISRTISEADDEVIRIREEQVDPLVGTYTTLVLETYNAANRDANENFVQPRFLKEPNHPLDDYPGATFSGIPSPAGIGNDYSAHLDDFHLYMEARMTTEYVVPANVQIEPLGVSVGNYFWLLRTSPESLPCSQHCDETGRGLQPGVLATNVYIALWKDVNGDKWPGSMCDPSDPNQWDSANDVCRSDSRYNGYPSYAPNSERLPICGTTTLSGGGSATTEGLGMRIYPAPGSTWEDAPGSLKLREWQRPTYNLWHLDEQQVPTGTDVMELELYSCSGNDDGTYAIDALFLPTGTLGINLVTDLYVRMTKTYVNADLGITIAPEELRDVDVYYASL